jgi:pilus assembly protein FimV
VAKPKPKPASAPQPKEPELMDQVLEAATDPLYLGVGGGVIALGGLAFFMARRRRAQAEDEDEPAVAPRLGKAAAAAAGAAAARSDTTAAPESAARTAAAEDVDPLAEAEVYMAYGRDGQAEEILKEALAKNPRRADVQLKLLEVYSARKDKAAFGKVASDLNKLTGGAGDNWIKAAAVVPRAAGAADIDLDIGTAGGVRTSTDINLDAETAEAATGVNTAILDLGALSAGQRGKPAAAMPDFTLEEPAAEGTRADIAHGAAAAVPAQDNNILDFKIELPEASADTISKVKPQAAASADAGVDFKLDGLSLSLDGAPKTAVAAAGGEKDGHWYDVQTKFDLAKAYQEMGDKDGAKEILREVIEEGDTDQKTQAKTLLDSLG